MLVIRNCSCRWNLHRGQCIRWTYQSSSHDRYCSELIFHRDRLELIFKPMQFWVDWDVIPKKMQKCSFCIRYLKSPGLSVLQHLCTSFIRTLQALLKMSFPKVSISRNRSSKISFLCLQQVPIF